MARYKQGESGNPAGRPVGSKNKVTPVTVDEVREFVNDNWEGHKAGFSEDGTIRSGSMLHPITSLCTPDAGGRYWRITEIIIIGC